MRLDNLEGGQGPRFISDTLLARNDNFAAGISSQSKGYIVVGSLIAVTSCTRASCGGDENTCLLVGQNGAPSTLLSTALACPNAFFGTGLGVSSVAELTGPSPDCTDQGGAHIRCGGIVDLYPLSLDIAFTDFEGPDGNAATISDSDFHYKSSAPAVLRNGGFDPTSTCGYVETPVACEATAIDADNAARTSPFSIGPYEY